MAKHPPGCQCGDEDAHVLLEGTQDFLFSKIDRDKVIALNADEPERGKIVIRPYDERMQEEEWLSRADSSKDFLVRSILIKSGPAGHTPDKMHVYANQMLDFDQATSFDATQSFDVAITRDVIEFAVRPAKFPSVHSLTLFFPSNHGEETSRISFVGFKGEYSAFTRDPVITVYEAQANPADHAKIPGLDETSHSRIG
ncbi:hypothetical protein OIO90_004042 [Microbotryomycetes sp. JL221]|nr:hypothetical protein OIO90_004042 [Microbotryomycetes sp. JL221]